MTEVLEYDATQWRWQGRRMAVWWRSRMNFGGWISRMNFGDEKNLKDQIEDQLWWLIMSALIWSNTQDWCWEHTGREQRLLTMSRTHRERAAAPYDVEKAGGGIDGGNMIDISVEDENQDRTAWSWDWSPSPLQNWQVSQDRGLGSRSVMWRAIPKPCRRRDWWWISIGCNRKSRFYRASGDGFRILQVRSGLQSTATIMVVYRWRETVDEVGAMCSRRLLQSMLRCTVGCWFSPSANVFAS